MSPSLAAQGFYRTFSDSSSASSLVSGKGREDRQLSFHELLYEFRNHKKGARQLNEDIYHEQLTALVSVTTSFIDVLRRAFNKLYGGDEPKHIWIVFISVPNEDEDIYHHAECLAKKIELKNTTVFKDEYIFEWEVPDKYVVHKLSVQTLLDRGFSMESYRDYSNNKRLLPPTSLLRQNIAQRILNPANGGYEIGMSLGFMARYFGARAPVQDIAQNILSDCSRIRYVSHYAQSIRVTYWDSHETTLDFEHFYWVERGIDEAIFDLWLNDFDFCMAYKEHCKWVSW